MKDTTLDRQEPVIRQKMGDMMAELRPVDRELNSWRWAWLALVLVLLILAVPTRSASAADCTWEGKDIFNPTDWNKSTNWSCNAIPGESDTATISSGTVTLGADTLVGVLNFSGGTIDLGGYTLTYDAAASVSNPLLTWTGGTFIHGTVVAQDALTVNVTIPTAPLILNNAILTANGTATLIGAIETSQPVNMASSTIAFNGITSLTGWFKIDSQASTATLDGAIILNLNSTLELSGETFINKLDLSGSGSLRVKNMSTTFTAGTTNLSGSTTFLNLDSTINFASDATVTSLGSPVEISVKQLTFQSALNAPGIFNVYAGTVTANTGATIGGAVTIASGASLAFVDGTVALTGALSGAGNLNIGSASANADVTVAGAFSPGGAVNVLNGSTLTLTGGGTTTGGLALSGNSTVTIPSGTLTFGAPTAPATGSFAAADGNVTISGGAVSFATNAAVSIKTLTFSDGNLLGTDNLTVTTLTWSGGVMTGSGTIAATSLSGATNNVVRTISGWNVTVASSLDLSANNSSIDLNSNASLTLKGGATIDDPINIPAGSTLSLSGGTFSISNGGSLNGAGAVNFGSDASAATVNFANASLCNITGTSTIKHVSTKITFAGNSLPTSLGSLVDIQDGTLILNSGKSPKIKTLTLAGGRIQGSDDLVIGTMNWGNGLLLLNANTTLSTGALNFSSTIPQTLDDIAFTISGVWDTTVLAASTWSGTAAITLDKGASLIITDAVTLTVTSSGTNLVQATGSEGLTLNGALVMNYTTAAESTAITVPLTFPAGSSISLQSGGLSLSGGGTLGGDISGTANGSLAFAGGTYTFSGVLNHRGGLTVSNGSLTLSSTSTLTSLSNTLTVSGGTLTVSTTSIPTALVNTMTISGGTLNLPAKALTVNTLALSSGTISGPTSQALTLTNLNWSGGTISGAGTTTTTNLNMTGTGARTLDERELVINNPVSVGAGSLSLTNAAKLNLKNGGEIGGDFVLANGCTLKLSAGTFTVGTALSGAGIVEFGSTGAPATVTINQAYTVSGTTTVANTGTLVTFGAGGSPTGTFTVTGGALAFTGGTFTLGSGVTTNLSAVDLSINGATAALVLNTGSAVTAQDLTLQAGTLTPQNGLTVSTFAWSGGTLSGTGPISTGALTYTAATSSTLDGIDLTLTGDSTWNSTGALILNNGAELTVSTTKKLTVTSSGASLFQSTAGAGSLNLAGSLIIDSPTPTAISVPVTLASGSSITLNGSGTPLAGGLTLSGGGTLSGSLISATALPLTFAGGAYPFAGTFNNGGALTVSGGSLSFTSGANLTRLGNPVTVSGGTLTLPAAPPAIDTLTLSSGTLSVPSGALSLSTFNWSSGTLSGAGSTTATAIDLTGSGSRTLSGHTLTTPASFSVPGGSLSLTSSATLNLGGGGSLNSSLSIGDGCALSLSAGTFTVSTALSGTGSLSIGSTGAATVSFSQAYSFSGGTTIANAGTTVTFGAGGSPTGSFSVTGGTLAFTGGTFTIPSGASLSSTLDLSINGATAVLVLNTGSAVTAQDLTLQAGTLTPQNGLTVSTFAWSGGTLSGAGPISTGALTYTAATSSTLDGIDLTLTGDSTWNSTGALILNNGAELTVSTTKKLTVTSSGASLFQSTAGVGSLNLVGSLIINSPTPTAISVPVTLASGSSITLNGSVTPLAGGLTLSGGGTLSGSLISATALPLTFAGGAYPFAGTFNNGGALTVSGGSLSFTSGANLTRLGNPVTVSGGTLTLPATPPAILTLTLSSGTLSVPSGALSLSTFNWSGGTLSGAGSTTATAIDLTGSGSRTLSGHTLTTPASFSVPGGSLSLTSSATLNLGGGGSLDSSFSIGNGCALSLSAGTFTVSTALSGTGSLSIGSTGAATVSFSQAYSFSGGTTIANAGTTVTFGAGGSPTGSFSVTGGTLAFTGGTFTLGNTATANLTAADLTINGATAKLVLNTHSAVTAHAVTLTNGEFSAEDSLTVTSLTWAGGTLSGTGPLSTAALNYTATSKRTLDRLNLTLTSDSTWNSAVAISLDSGAAFTIASGATLTVTSSGASLFETATIHTPGSLAIIGDLVINSANATVITVPTTLPAGSAIEINGSGTPVTGGLSLSGGGILAGDINAASGTVLTLNDGDFTTSGIFNNLGALTISGGSLTFTGVAENLKAIGSPVTISGGALALAPVSQTIQTLTLEDGSISGPVGADKTLTLTTLNWSGGTISGAGTTITTNLNMAGTGTRTLDERELVINNPVSVGAGSLSLTNAAKLDLRNGGEIGGDFVLANGCTLKLSAGTFTVGAALSGAGIVEFGSATASTPAIVTISRLYTISGKTTIATPATPATPVTSVTFGAGGSPTGDFTVTGGALAFTGGTFTLGNTATANLTAAAITVSIADTACAADPTCATATDLNFSTGKAVTLTSLDLQDGSVGGTDSLTTGSFAWSGGVLDGDGSISTTILTYTAATTRTLNAYDLTLAGNSTWNSSVALSLNNGSVFTIASGATLSVTGSGASLFETGTSASPGQLTISGALVKSSTADTRISIPTTTTASGSIALNNGGLIFSLGGNMAGSLTAASGTSLEFAGGNIPFSGTFSNAGSLTISGGALTFADTATLNNTDTGSPVTISGGALALPPTDLAINTLNLTSGSISGPTSHTLTLTSFTWASGQISGEGTTTAPGMDFTGTGARTLNRRTVSITGSVTSGTGSLNLTNQAILDLGGGGNLGETYTVGTGSSLRLSAGTFNVAGSVSGNGSAVFGSASQSAAVTFTQLYNITGGTTIHNSATQVTFSAGGTPAGPISVTGGTMAFTGGTFTFSNDDTVDLSGANLSVSATATVLNFSTGSPVSAKKLTIQDGTINTEDDIDLTSINWSGGTIAGSTSNASRESITAGPLDLSGTGSGARVLSAASLSVGLVTAGSGSLDLVDNARLDLNNGGTLTSPVSVASGSTLSFSNGNFTLSDDLTGPGSFEFGSLATAATVTINGAVNISGQSTFTNTSSQITFNTTVTNLGNPTIINGAAVTAVQAVTNSGAITINSGSLICQSGSSLSGNIANDGTLTLQQGNFPLPGNLSGTGTINIGGSSMTGLAAVSGVFDFSGTTNVNNGSLTLSGGGSPGGSIKPAAAGAVTFLSGTYTVGANFSGAGPVTFGSSSQSVSATLNGTYNISGTTTFNNSSSAVTFSAAAQITNLGSTVELSGPTLTLSTGETVPMGTFNVTAGRLSGSDALNMTTLNWSGGTLGSGGTSQMDILNFNGPAEKILDGRTLAAADQINWNSTVPLIANNGGTITNQTGSVFTITASHPNLILTNTSTTPGVLNNYGTMTITNPDTTSIHVVFNNYATLDVQDGELALYGGGTVSGNIMISSGATLVFGVSTFTQQPGSSITGAGIVKFDFAAATISGTYAITGGTTFISSSVTFKPEATLNIGDSTLTINQSSVTFNSGEAQNSSTINMLSGTLTGSDSISISTLNWSGGTLTGATGAAPFQVVSLNYTGTLNRDLVARNMVITGLSSWIGSGTLIITNATLTNQTGATLTFAPDKDSMLMLGMGTTHTFINRGGLSVQGPSVNSENAFNIPITNAGAIEILQGNTSFARSFSQTTGSLRLNGGSLTMTNPAQALEINGGLLTGYGSFKGNLNLNYGTLDPDGGSRVFDVTGSYKQTAGATLKIDCTYNSKTSAYECDQVKVTGSAALDGTLSINLDTPTGSAVQISTQNIASASDMPVIFTSTDPYTGSFATIIKNGVTLSPIYTTYAIVLTDADASTLADLKISVSNGQSYVTPDLQTTYTITITNSGPGKATSSSLTYTLPPELLNTSWTCAASSGSSCAAASGSGAARPAFNIVLGGTITVKLTGKIDQAATGELTCAASVSYTSDPDTRNNAAADTDKVMDPLGFKIFLPSVTR